MWYDEIPEEEIQTLDKGNKLTTEIPQEIKTEVNDSVIVAKANAPKSAPILDITPKAALKIIGYDVSDMPAAIKAFKLHFIQTEVNSTLTDHDLKVLNNLYKKYL